MSGKARGLKDRNPYTLQVVQQSTYVQRQYVQQTFQKAKFPWSQNLNIPPYTTDVPKSKISLITKLKYAPLHNRRSKKQNFPHHKTSIYPLTQLTFQKAKFPWSQNLNITPYTTDVPKSKISLVTKFKYTPLHNRHSKKQNFPGKKT